MARELVRTNPATSVLNLQDEVNDLFREFFRGFDRDGLFPGLAAHSWAPAADIEETEDSYVVSCDVPGMTQKDLKVTIENNILSITGERKGGRQDGKRGSVRTERVWGAFSRSFMLPRSVDPEKVKAVTKDGVLEVTLPKRPEAKARSIEVAVQ